MSDDNRIIIDGANFDRSMPKWATQETLSRIEQASKNAHKDQQKVLKEAAKTLRDISRINSDLFRDSKASNSKVLKELQKLTKMFGESNKSSSKDKSAEDTKKSLKEISNTNKSESKKIVDGVTGLGKNQDKNADKLKDAINKTAEKENKTSEKILDSSKKVVGAVEASSKEITDLLKTANEINKRSELLLKTIAGNSPNSGGSGAPASPGNDSNADRFENEVVTGIQHINANLVNIQRTLDHQNSVSRSILSNTTNKEDLSKIIEQQTREYARASRTSQERSGNRMRDMFEGARNASSNGGQMGGLSKILGKLSTSLGGLVKVIRATPIGALMSGAMAAATIVNKTAEYTYDAQRDFRDMMDRGFTFNVLGAEEIKNGESRLDGISMRRTITENGVGLETATKVLEHNTRLVNDLGLSNMFGEIGNVLGATNDPNSFVNQIGLTRDHVAMMVGDFYAMSNRVTNLNEEYSAIERENLAQEFIRNVRGMSATLGVSMEEIRQHIAEFTKTDEFLATDTYMGDSELIKGALGGSGWAKEIQDALFYTIISPLGAVDERVQNAIGDDIGGNYLFSALQNLDFDHEAYANSDDKNGMIMDMMKQFRDTVDDSTAHLSRDGVNSDLGWATALNSQGMAMIANVLQNEVKTTLNAPRETPEDRQGRTSDINQQALFLENFKQGLVADTENAFAQMADTAVGRDAIKAVMSADEIMKEAQLAIVGGLTDIAELLDGGPIPKILSMVRTGIRHMINIMQDIPLIGNKPKHSDGIDGWDGITYMQALQNGEVFNSEQFDKIFNQTTNDDGDDVIDFKEGITPEIFSNIMKEALDNASTFEEKEKIVALAKSLERGIDTGDLETSENLERAMANINSDLRYHATRNVGDEDRKHFEDMFDGHIDSFDVNARGLGELLGSIDDQIALSGANSAASQQERDVITSMAQGNQPTNTANSPVVNNRPINTPSPTTEVDDDQINHLNSVVESLTRAIDQQHQQYLEQQRQNEAELQTLREEMSGMAVDSSYRSIEALKSFGSVADSEDLLDTGLSPEELISITNRLLAENNSIARLNVQSSTEQRQNIQDAIDGNDTNISIGQVNVDTDDMINLNPVIRAINDAKMLISENLSEIYRVLGGDLFAEVDSTSFNSSRRRGGSGNVNVRSDSDFDDFFARLTKQESGDRQLDANGNPLTSWAGAVGAAQIMPGTARDIAKKHGIEFDDNAYRTDEDYNKMLGKLHIQDLLDQYDGDTVLTSLAYNAGEGGVQRMMELYGDPREGNITHDEFLDLIEQNHSGDRNSWGVQSVPYARNVSFLGTERDVAIGNPGFEPSQVRTVGSRSPLDDPDQSGLLGIMNNQLTEQRSSSGTLLDILDHLRNGVGVEPDSGLYASIGNNPNTGTPVENQSFIHRSEVESMISQAIQDYEANAMRQKAENRNTEEQPLQAQTPVEVPQSDESMSSALNSISATNERVVAAIENQTRALEGFMNKTI